MIKSKLRALFTICIVLGALGATSPAYAYSVYREVTANAAGVVVWNLTSFYVNGNPATLSFMHYADDAAARLARPDVQCFVKVDLPGIDNPQQNEHSNVGNANIHFNAAAGDMPLPFPWAIVFDNNPAGHWSIAKATISASPANNAAGRVAAIGFQTLATTPQSGVVVINGSLGNCAAQ